MASRMGARYMECSSKEMKGVEEIFATAIDIAVNEEDATRKNTPQAPGGGGRKGKKKTTCKIL